MPTEEDVQRLALSLPGAVQDPEHFRFRFRDKLFVWSFMEKPAPDKPRARRPDVLAVRVRNEWEKSAMLQADPEVFFTTDHYNGYPAVLVRLPEIDLDELEGLIVAAWRLRAPRGLVKEYDSAGTRQVLSQCRGSPASPGA